MKVEQSIQRVSNGPGGATRNVSAVAVYNEFEPLFDETGSKTNSSYHPHHQPSEGQHRLSSASPACTA